MRRLLLIIMIAAATSSCLAAKKKQLTILHTNDTHSCILPLNSNLADTLLAGRGGFLRRAAMVRQERQKQPDMLLLDCGD